MDARPRPATTGGPAPPLAIRIGDSRVVPPLTLDTLDGQPLVLALLDGDAASPGEASADDLARARAELRGLGAVLLAVSDRGLWCFRPDDEAQLVAGPGALDADDVRAVRARYGVPDGSPAALFVIDGDRILRFAHVVMPPGPGAARVPATFRALVEALGIAGRAMYTSRSGAFTLTRRELVVASLAGALVLALAEGCATTPHAGTPAGAAAATDGGDLDVTLDVNGARRTVRIDPRVTLLDALRERMGLPGTKKGCDQGQCGACTVLLGGRRVKSCLTLAVMCDGVAITTIEGLARGGELHPLQAAFIAEDAFQCGYCTSGQLMSAAGLLAEGQARTDDEVRAAMSGNICRCGAYPNIVAAIQRARGES